MADSKEIEDEEETESTETEVAPEEETESEESEAEGEGEPGGEEKPAATAGGEGESAGDKPGAESRGSKRIAALARERDEFKERAVRAETLAEERARHPATQQNQAEQARLRDEKLALMDPQEKRDFLRDEELAGMKQTVLLTQLQTQDAIDRQAFNARAINDPVFSKHAQDVEQRLYKERQQGRNWPRETILAQIIGENALKAKPKASEKAAAKDRVKSSEGKPASGRSNANAYKSGRAGESLAELEARLENQVF